VPGLPSSRGTAEDRLDDRRLPGGRTYLGLGAGWFEREAVGLGIPFPARHERFERLEETLQRHKLRVLAEHCAATGRPYASIERTVVTYLTLGPGGMRAAEVVDLCGALAELGFSHMIFNIPNCDTLAPIEQLGHAVIPLVTPFQAASAPPGRPVVADRAYALHHTSR
jgi:hypothetical protein